MANTFWNKVMNGHYVLGHLCGCTFIIGTTFQQDNSELIEKMEKYLLANICLPW